MQPFLEYHRPESLDDALALLSRRTPKTRPLAGGTHYRRGLPPVESVVDLSALHLNEIKLQDHSWTLGALLTLEDLVQAEGLPPALRQSARRQNTRNLRQSATLGGLIATADSGPLLASLLALETQVSTEPGNQTLPLEEYLRQRGTAAEGVDLIVGVSFNRERKLGTAEISRTPSDLALMVVAVSGMGDEGGLHRVRVATGAAAQPLTLCSQTAGLLEGASGTALPPAALDASVEAQWVDDIRGSADYRKAMMPILLKRAIQNLRAAG